MPSSTRFHRVESGAVTKPSNGKHVLQSTVHLAKRHPSSPFVTEIGVTYSYVRSVEVRLGYWIER